MRAAAVLCLAALLGCKEGENASATFASGPGIGKGDSLDSADHECRLVLLDVAVDVVGTIPGNIWVEWVGHVAPADDLPAGAEVHVMYRGTDQPLLDVEVDGSGEFHLVDRTIRAGSGGLFDTRSVDLIPYVALPDGERIFDHNRVPGDTDMYRLDASNNHSIPQDARVCADVPATDQADRNCRVVLRGIAVDVVSSIPGNIWVEWQGFVSIAELPDGSQARVMYQSTSSQGWLEVPVSSDGGFRLVDQTIRSGLSGGIFDSQFVEVMPYVELVDGSRLFDHNRVAGDTDNYRLDKTNRHQIADDPAICPF